MEQLIQELSGVDRSRIAGVERRSGTAYLHAVFAAHAAGRIVIAVDPHAPALPPGIAPETVTSCAPGGGWFGEHVAPRDDDAPAQIVLTSGTTGVPKPMLLSHRALGDVTRRLVEVMRLDADVREYVGVPVDYSFGFGRVRAVAAAGGRCFLPERGFRVDELAHMLARGEVNALSAVPTLLRTVITNRHRFADCGEALRWLEIGSQAMTPEEKASIRAIFPAARIVQHYGLTEASRSTFLVVSDGEQLDTAGRPNGAVEVEIREEGLIAIRGPHVASGIVGADGAILPITDADGWLVTRDLGRLDGGALVFEGRADDLINVAGIKVPAERFEEALRAELGTEAPLAVTGAADFLRGELVVVAFEEGGVDPATLAEATRRMAAEFRIGDGFALFPMEALPRTATGKVQRRAIAARFADRPAATHESEMPSPAAGDDPARTVVAAFVSAFGEDGRDEGATFRSLGGDSLTYVRVMLALEPALPDLPEAWDDMPIALLCDRARSGGSPEGRAEAVHHAFADAFGARATPEASFASLGGDEADHLRLAPALEHALGSLPADWEALPARDLAARAAAPPAGTRRRFVPRNADTVRGLACLLVVALHVVGVDGSDGLKIPPGSGWHRVMEALELIRMPLFTGLAGFLFGAMPPRSGVLPFLGTKARQLGIPLVFATLIYFFTRRHTYGTDESLVEAFTWGYRHLWYLDALFMMFIVCAVMDAWVRATERHWLGLLGLIALTYWAVPPIHLLHVRVALGLFPFFIVGLLLYRYPHFILDRRLVAASVVAIVAAVAAQQLAPHLFGAIDRFGLFRWSCGVGAMLVALRLLPVVPTLAHIGTYSFTIYLWHPFSNGVVRNTLMHLGLHHVPTLFVIGVAAGVGLPILLHRVAMRAPRAISLPLTGR